MPDVRNVCTHTACFECDVGVTVLLGGRTLTICERGWQDSTTEANRHLCQEPTQICQDSQAIPAVWPDSNHLPHATPSADKRQLRSAFSTKAMYFSLQIDYYKSSFEPEIYTKSWIAKVNLAHTVQLKIFNYITDYRIERSFMSVGINFLHRRIHVLRVHTMLRLRW